MTTKNPTSRQLTALRDLITRRLPGAEQSWLTDAIETLVDALDQQLAENKKQQKIMAEVVTALKSAVAALDSRRARGERPDDPCQASKSWRGATAPERNDR